MRFVLTAVGLWILAAVALTSPGGAEPGHLRTDAVAAVSLTGTTWVLAKLRGNAPLRNTAITSTFKAGKVSGSSGCNLFSGTYRSSKGTIRVSSRLVTTQRACAEAVGSQEEAFLAALKASRRYQIEGAKLRLVSANGTSVLIYRAQSQQLAGTSWTVVAYNNGKQGVASVLAGTTLTAVFGKDGRIAGFAGCNDYQGSAAATAPRISVGPLASTKKFCAEPGGVMDQESQYLAALETAATYRVEGPRLELRTADGALAAELQRA